MKTRIMTAEIINLGMLDRLNHRLRNQLQLVVDASQMLGYIQDQCRATTQQLAAVTADNRTILQFNRSRSMACLLLMILSRYSHLAIIRSNLSLLEKQLNLADLLLVARTSRQLVGSRIITADNLVLRSLAANLIIRDAEAHIFTPISVGDL